ncbi:Aste57867_9390 [Aphanomyces stellatus]|uniref:Aste57867_9390 protein n=1 Tax=Aphanomyces stellatus TaxID=120398 RepID=A0A485KMR0_9STRA|nr:hypothetical protein As57867_009354 [Aphanomyces stellatus]VFT86270.1 Aste57867_9390 [Aphanomyces stellatus]
MQHTITPVATTSTSMVVVVPAAAYDDHHCHIDGAEGSGTWTALEHNRFLEGIRLYPKGPWKSVAAIVRTRTVRQIRTHAQKYREKIARHQRGLRVKSPSRLGDIDDDDATSSNSTSAPSSPAASSVLMMDPLSVDQVNCWWEPLQASCSATQLDECLVFLSDALYNDAKLDSLVKFEV